MNGRKRWVSSIAVRLKAARFSASVPSTSAGSSRPQWSELYWPARLLRDGHVCVCEMASALGERQNNVSNHLAKLRAGGLVRPGRVVADTQRVYYERDDEACLGALEALGEVLGGPRWSLGAIVRLTRVPGRAARP